MDKSKVFCLVFLLSLLVFDHQDYLAIVMRIMTDCRKSILIILGITHKSANGNHSMGGNMISEVIRLQSENEVIYKSRGFK